MEKRLGSIIDLSRQGKRINGLFRLLASPLLWEMAYAQIAPNKGALTPGVDPANTLDGFSLERMERIIGAVMDGSYRFSPARRQYIPKPNGKKRPLGIPTADDKLVQAAVKILLDHVYEPVFSEQSHGFRRGRSCHTALSEIRRTWHGVKWLIEVDIAGYYDNIDHDILLALLRKRMDDERLIRLIGRMLKAGYLEDWRFHKTFSGTPQGGVISPILANIYLHELDGFMAEMKTGFDRGTMRRRSAHYLECSKQIQIRRRMIERRRARHHEEEIPALIEEIREWERRRLLAPSVDPFDPDYRRLRYCRYADDFVIGIIGSKEEARKVMEEVRAFLAQHLKLQVSEEKSGISKASEGATFLGYGLKTYGDGRTKRMVKAGRAVTMRVPDDRMQLHVPVDRLARFAERQQLGNLHTNQGEARHSVINNSDLAILTGYNALMRGFAEYYKLGTLWKQEVSRLHHLWWWSLMKTLSRKHKCSVRRTAERLRNGDRLGLWYEGRHARRFMPMFRLKDIRPAQISAHVDREPTGTMYFAGRNDIIDHLRARTCQACGAIDVPLEVHHARKMSDMEGTTLWTRVKAARTRKRVVLCRECHVAHHAGRLQARLDRMMQA
ncbi:MULTISPECIES: reverse transcriptase domain-containing protein [unclassified Azospirillum]|uniref:reverse transcriptase domain-containing protein n=1 Tax=unclassified Azospirillum TaxID=2630922 RepID=UPI001359061B|nr:MULTISPECIES: reverse transcriptase domain-containing protein [unclassified Azospirillum]